MKCFWIVIRAPAEGATSVSKNPGNIYLDQEAAERRAHEIAFQEGVAMLVLEVVSGFGPVVPKIQRLVIDKSKKRGK